MTARLPNVNVDLQSLGSHLFQKSTTPFAIALGLGFSATSYFLYGNLSHLQWGVVRAVHDEGLQKQGIQTPEAVKLFAWHYEKAAPHMASASAIGAASYFIAAWLYRPVITTPSLRPLLIAAGLFAVVPGPWTLSQMMPTNKKLLALRDSLSNGTKESLTPQEEREVWDNLDKWKKMHNVRIASATIAWVTALATLVLY